MCVCALLLSHVQLFVIPWTCSLPVSSIHGIFQARILEWVAISFSRNLPYPGMELTSLVSPALAGRLFTTESPEKPIFSYINTQTQAHTHRDIHPELLLDSLVQNHTLNNSQSDSPPLNQFIQLEENLKTIQNDVIFLNVLIIKLIKIIILLRSSEHP